MPNSTQKLGCKTYSYWPGLVQLEPRPKTLWSSILKCTFFTAADIDTKIGSILLIKFNAADADNDQSLDMNEFAHYATILYDAIGFYSKALRNSKAGHDPEKIEQIEWDCTKAQIDSATGCTPNKYDVTKVCLNVVKFIPHAMGAVK